MSRAADGNADWIARQEGRIPSKGAMAAERASAGLGATDHNAELLEERLVLGGMRNQATATPPKVDKASTPQQTSS
jgi:hypothetical protein